MNQSNRPYTTAEVAALMRRLGIQFERGGYVSNVIHNPKRSTPHPLLAAHLAKGMWDRELINQWIAEQESK